MAKATTALSPNATYDHPAACLSAERALAEALVVVKDTSAELQAAEIALEEVAGERLTLANRKALRDKRGAAEFDVAQLSQMLLDAEAAAKSARWALPNVSVDLARALVPMVTAALLPVGIPLTVLPYIPTGVPAVLPAAVIAQTGPASHHPSGYIASHDRWSSDQGERIVHLIHYRRDGYVTPSADDLISAATGLDVNLGQHIGGGYVEPVRVSTAIVGDVTVTTLSISVLSVMEPTPIVDQASFLYEPTAPPLDLEAAVVDLLWPSNLSGGRVQAPCFSEVKSNVVKGDIRTMVVSLRLVVTSTSLETRRSSASRSSASSVGSGRRFAAGSVLAPHWRSSLRRHRRVPTPWPAPS